MAVYNNNLKFAIVDTSNNNTDLLINQFAATIEGIATGVKPSLASNNPTGPGYLYGIQDMTSPWYWLALTGGSDDQNLLNPDRVGYQAANSPLLIWFDGRLIIA